MFFFAWCGPNEELSPAHLREDEIVLDFDIAHLEGQIPTLSIDIKNPHIGLLAVGRKQWMRFTYQSPNDDTVTPLFYGRLVALPTNLLAEVVTLQFLARPTDFLAQKQTVANALMVSPYYDPVWIAQDKWTDPDTILETYTSAWHIDRASLVVTTSDMIFGEDGTEEFRPEDSFYDTVAISFGQAPQTQVVCTGAVTWTQAASNVIKMPNVYCSACNGDQWLSDWPKPGASLQGGWSVVSSQIVDINNVAQANTTSFNVSWQNQDSRHEDGDTMSVSISQTVGNPGNFITGSVNVASGYSFTVGDPDTGTAAASSASDNWLTLMIYDLAASLSLQWDMSRGRTENIAFVMNSNLQNVMTNPVDEPPIPIQLSMQGSDVGLNLNGDVPIGSASRSMFFPTDRGIQALQYPLLLARAHLLQSARAAKISFDCTLERALTLSCRKNALLHDSRLPGGQALGKITEYHIKGSGDTGDLSGSIQIECTIGTGDTSAVIISEGVPEYVAEGYVTVGYQAYTGTTYALPTEDVTFAVPIAAANDPAPSATYAFHQGSVNVNYLPYFDPIPLSSTIGAPDAAAAAGDQTQAVQQGWDEMVKNDPTWIELTLSPVTGDFAALYGIPVGTLVVPKMIDLSAPNA